MRIMGELSMDRWADSTTHPHANTTIALDDSLLAVRERVPRLQRLQLDGELHGSAVAAAVV